jgi:glycosyltransferase involved in cell wall biosynthesis
MRRVVRIVTRLNRGGPTRQIEALAPRLPAHGWDGPVLVGAADPGEGDARAEFEARGLDVRTLPGLGRRPAPWRDLRAFVALVAGLRREQPDLVHTHMGKAGALGRLAGRLLDVPVVHTLHGHHFDAPSWRGRAARGAERGLGRLADAIVALSPRQGDDIAAALGRAAVERVFVVPPGLDVDALVAAARQPLPVALTPDRLHVLFAGRLVRVKRVDRLLEAFARVVRAVPHADLHVLGDGPLRSRLEAQAHALGLGTCVHFRGAVDAAAPWLAAADVVVLSSESEGTPLALLEALALGRPIVAPAVGGIPDIVADGVHGRVVAPHDTGDLAAGLLDLLADPALRRRMGAAGPDHVRSRFGAGRLAEGTAALYDHVLARRTSGVPSRP